MGIENYTIKDLIDKGLIELDGHISKKLEKRLGFYPYRARFVPEGIIYYVGRGLGSGSGSDLNQKRQSGPGGGFEGSTPYKPGPGCNNIKIRSWQDTFREEISLVLK